MPFGVASLGQFLVVARNIGLAIVFQGSNHIYDKRKAQQGGAKTAEYLRQRPIMLQLIFHLGQLLDDAFAILGLFVISNRSNSPMKIIDCTRLVTSLVIGSRILV